MQVTINLPDEMSVTLKKISQTLTVNPSAFPDNSREHIFAYGLRQLLNDAMASHKAEDIKTDADKAAARADAQDRLDNLLAGTIRATREGDPIAREAKEMAGLEVDAALLGHYKTEAAVKAAAKAKAFNRTEFVNAHFADNRERLMGEAKVALEARAKALAGVKVNLKGLK